ncbi:MAG: 3-methyl-2-oxobutanoate dehydrogenase subunit VorB [Bacillota bacterium]|jgi:2-oxoglutarate ferredoxin oxidoreductase subunit alpha
MGEKILMKGNEAVGEAAIRAGCRFFFGYPITPQNELPEYMARRLPEVGGTMVQAESEIAAINMVYGAAGAGARVMTSSSSPGISLKQEGISYIAGAELPCVIVNMVRGGPGLGGIQPAQSDYFQAVKGGGHGDYHVIVLAPASLQELVDLVQEAFDIADLYRNPVMVLGDGMLGQMMEPVQFRDGRSAEIPEKTWATSGIGNHPGRNVINSLYLQPDKLEQHNIHLQQKYATIAKNEVRYETVDVEDADIVVAAYGSTARIVRTAMKAAKEEGLKVGLIRPISLWPFPVAPFQAAAEQAQAFLTVEMSAGQMVEDVRLAVNGKKPVHFFGRTGGIIPTPEDVLAKIKEILGGNA